jgi:glycosyltransferase involved in cell wall biosynthesis
MSWQSDHPPWRHRIRESMTTLSQQEQAGTGIGARVLVDVVIPVLNEAHVLEKSVGAIREFLAASAPWLWRLVIVDNGSTDGTDRVARHLTGQYPDLRFLQLQERGRGRALRQAWTLSDAEVMCYMDVDLSTELAALPKLVHALLHEGYDLGTGSRLQAQSRTSRSWKREVISRIYNRIVKVILRTSFSDAQCGFKVVSRRVVREVVPSVADQSWFFDTELMVRAERQGYRIKDLPVEWKEDDDSRVRILRTAWDDLKGITRLRLEFWREALRRRRRPMLAVAEPADPANPTPP